MSADPYIQAPENLLSYNRYSYLMNNPLNGTDPSGHFGIKSIFKEVSNGWKSVWNSELGRIAITVAVAYFTGYYDWGTALGGSSYVGVFGSAGIGNAMAAGFAGGFVGSGGNFQAGLQGAATGALFYGAGSVADMGKFAEGSLGRAALHAVAGCAGSSLGGGDCGKGALAAGFAEGIGGNIKFSNDVAALTARAVIGGTASLLGGGKFSNGAITASFGYLFNHMAHRDALGEMSATNEAVAQAPEAPLDAAPEPMQLAANINPSGGCAGGGLNAALACGSGGGGSISVTRSGVALPADPKYAIPPGYVQNPYGRSGSYGEVVNGRFVERLRIDSATPAGMKGPNTSHYHLDGKGTHYSPAPGDKNPGFLP